MKKQVLLFILPLLFLCNSCAVTLSGASIPPDLKTVNVKFFENNAPLVVNNLSQLFTEALKDRIRSSTSLGVVRGEADGTFDGQIIGYTIVPVAIQATSDNRAPIAGQTRLTITVQVSFTTSPTVKDKKNDFNNITFARYKDYTGDIAPQEQILIQDINKQLTEDIFNKAFANW